MSTIAMIEAAGARLSGHARVTPLLSSPFLDEIAGRPVFVKAECLQHTGSFKFRGAWNAITAKAPSGVIAYSSGNHAQGVALAARMKGLPAVIVMPRDAPAIKIENTRALGAEVVLYDREREDREAIGAKLARARDLELIKPYDMDETIAGQGTCGLEIIAQAAEMGVERGQIYAPCGGGGLTAGLALAAEARGPGFAVHPCEPEGFDDVKRSQEAGERQRNATMGGASICDAIVTPMPGALTWPILKRLCGPGQVVREDEALRAMALAWERLKIVVEPGGAVALAAALFRPGDGPVIAVASGGNVDRSVMARALSL